MNYPCVGYCVPRSAKEKELDLPSIDVQSTLFRTDPTGYPYRSNALAVPPSQVPGLCILTVEYFPVLGER